MERWDEVDRYLAERLAPGEAAFTEALEASAAAGLPPADVSPAERELLEDYMRAYETGDTGATLALLAEDVRVTMPPAPYLFEGRDAILGLAARARSTGEWRLVATGANRQPAAACYLRAPGDGEFRTFKIDVLRAVDGLVAEVTTFGAKHFPAFGLPAVLP